MWHICHFNLIFSHKTVSGMSQYFNSTLTRPRKTRWQHGSLFCICCTQLESGKTRADHCIPLLHLTFSTLRHMSPYSLLHRYQCSEQMCCLQTWILIQNPLSGCSSIQHWHIWIPPYQEGRTSELRVLPTEMQRPKHISPFLVLSEGFSCILVPVYQTAHIMSYHLLSVARFRLPCNLLHEVSGHIPKLRFLQWWQWFLLGCLNWRVNTMHRDRNDPPQLCFKV